MARARVDWTLLPSDMISGIADRLLASDDLDYYMDFRAVCRSWRSATGNPKSSLEEPRFRPRRWVIIDDCGSIDENDDTRLFVNLTTGRFLRKRLPQLRRYYLVSTTTGGSVVLAEMKPPHAPLVLNPFTGSLTRFVAPLPGGWNNFTAAVVGPADSSFTLVLASDRSRKVYWANLESEAFLFQKIDSRSTNGCPSGLLPYIAGEFVNRRDGSVVGDPDQRHPGHVRSCQLEHRVLTADAGGGVVFMVTVEYESDRVQVFKKQMGTDSNEFEPVTSIGNYALFAGDRSVLVDADKFPSIEPNCIYYTLPDLVGCFPDANIVYDLNGGEAKGLSESIPFSPAVRDVVSCYSLVQLLIRYTENIPGYRLMWEQLPKKLDED